MEKKALTPEMIESGKSFDELGFTVFDFVPFDQIVEAGFELARLSTVAASNGNVIYKTPIAKMYTVYVALKYFTNIDTESWNTYDGIMVLVDFSRKQLPLKKDLFMNAGFSLVEEIGASVYQVALDKHKEENSTARRINRVLDILLNMENRINESTYNPEFNEKIIDALKLLNNKEEQDEKSNVLTMFAKK